MSPESTFSREIANLLYAEKGSPLSTCMQCGTCTAGCPAIAFMQHSPRELIAMIAADRKEQVLASNTFWLCASCYLCTVRCPRGINVADVMYALKRYTLWRNKYRRGLIGPSFSKQFVKMICRLGKSYEPALAPAYLFRYGFLGFVHEGMTALTLLRKGRMPLVPRRIRRIKNFRRMLSRIILLPEAV